MFGSYILLSSRVVSCRTLFFFFFASVNLWCENKADSESVVNLVSICGSVVFHSDTHSLYCQGVLSSGCYLGCK